jgi:hypothetical protein
MSLLTLLARLSAAIVLSAVAVQAQAQGDARSFIQQSVAGLQAQQSANDGTWKMREASKWDIDQDNGLIVFSFADGKTASAPVQIVGTFNPKDGTFMWGWGHPAVDPALRRAASTTLEWARKNKLERWTSRTVACTEAEAWEFTAVAARLDSATGAYRAPAGGPLVFVVFGQVTLKPAGAR